MASKTLNVYLIRLGTNRVEELTMKACIERVQEELDTIARASGGKLRFIVSEVDQARNASAEDLVVYIMPYESFGMALSEAKKRRTNMTDGEVKKLQGYLASKGHAAVGSGRNSVAFVTNDDYEYTSAPFVDATKSKRHLGRELANAVLHELGHCMGIDDHDHSGGLMRATIPVRSMISDPRPPIHFTPKARKRMVDHLLSL